MSLRHAVLGLLSIEPSTGYELTRRFDSSLANAWHASHSQIYPLLSRMEREGLIEVASEGARRSRTWAVTDAGRSELREWLVTTEPDRGQRNESGLRWFMQELLDPADRRVVLERELAFMRDAHAQLLAQAERKRHEQGGRPRGFGGALDLGLQLSSLWFRDVACLLWHTAELVHNSDRTSELARDAEGRRAESLRAAVELVEETRRRLRSNVTEELALEALAYRLEALLT